MGVLTSENKLIIKRLACDHEPKYTQVDDHVEMICQVCFLVFDELVGCLVDQIGLLAPAVKCPNPAVALAPIAVCDDHDISQLIPKLVPKEIKLTKTTEGWVIEAW